MRSTDNQTQDSRQFGLAHSAVRDIRFQFQNLKYNEYNMTIGTKYNIGDEVWVCVDNTPIQGKVRAINARISKLGDSLKGIVRYEILSYMLPYEECQVFSTKEELLKSL